MTGHQQANFIRDSGRGAQMKCGRMAAIFTLPNLALLLGTTSSALELRALDQRIPSVTQMAQFCTFTTDKGRYHSR